MNYQTYQPCPELASLIKCYWILEVPISAEKQRQRILPDGCIDMIFTLGDDIKRYTSEEDYILQPRSMILGQITKPFDIEPIGYVDTFAIRFYPYGFANFTPHPISELANKETPISSIFEKEIAARLEEEVIKAHNTKERIEIIERFFVSKAKENIESIVKTTIDSIMLSKGQASVNALLKDEPSKRRQLERKFSKQIGLSPKQFAKVIRLQATLKLLLQGNSENLTQVAYSSSFFDQSHFIKDFKEFTGVKPKDFYHSDSLMLSSLIYENE